jgi:hypothetical protein
MDLVQKLDTEGKVSRYKVRLAAHSFKQRPGFDFVEMHAPPVSLAAVRLVLSYAAGRNLEIYQLHIVGAFLQSEMKEEIYLQLPKAFGRIGGKAHLHGLFQEYDKSKVSIIVKRMKRLYGTKQAAINWYEMFYKEMLQEECGRLMLRR